MQTFIGHANVETYDCNGTLFSLVANVKVKFNTVENVSIVSSQNTHFSLFSVSLYLHIRSSEYNSHVQNSITIH